MYIIDVTQVIRRNQIHFKMDKVKLYIGKSMGELNKNSNYKFDSSRSTKIHINHSDKTFQAAEEARLKKDEERAYILYMRYIDIVRKVRSSQGYKKDAEHYSLLLGTNKVMDALGKAEVLSQSLRERYDELQNASATNGNHESKNSQHNGELIPKQATTTNSQVDAKPVPSQIENRTEPLIPKDAKSITCKKLQGLLFSNRITHDKVLMMDIRDPEEYKSSCIRHPNCINVPKTHIQPGSVCKNIERGITDPDHLTEWKNRATADFIVLIDWRASLKRLEDLKDPLRSLKDALHKWEQDIFLKREPLILSGGFIDWLDYYPQFSTNPSVQRPYEKPRNVTSISDLLNFSYSSLIVNGNDDMKAIDSNGKEAVDDWEAAEYLTEKKLPEPKMNSTEVDSKPKINNSDTITFSTLYSDLPKDINLSHTIKNDATTKSNKPDRPSGRSVIVPKKTVPAIDRTSKPKIPSRQLKPNIVETDKANGINSPEVENWPPQSFTSLREESLTPEKSPDEAEEVLAAIKRIEEMKKKKEEEEQKTKELEDKRRMADLHAEAKRLEEEALEIARKNKLAEKQLADTMRQQLKPSNRIEEMKKKKEEEEQKTKELEEKKRMAGQQAEAKRLEEEALEIAIKNKLAEKQLANTMRQQLKPSKPADDNIKEKTTTNGGENEALQNLDATKVLKDKKDLKVLVVEEENALIVNSGNGGLHSEIVKVETEKAENGCDNNKTIQQTRPKPSISREKKPAATVPIDKGKVDDPSTKDINNDPKSMHQKLKTTDNITETKSDVKVNPVNVPKKPRPTSTNTKSQSNVTTVRNEDATETSTKKRVVTSANAKGRLEPKSPTPRLLPSPKPSSEKLDISVSSNLPLNWEKRLDSKTGRYYYLDHSTKTTHWQLPSHVFDRSLKKIPLKDTEAPPSGSLKRVRSTPDIAQLVSREPEKSFPEVRGKPLPNRNNKPNFDQLAIPDSPAEYASRLERLQPVFGGSGPGKCGLLNLGNTCYMNSVLQCMFNTTFLAEYFLKNLYKRDVNRENFLGSKGEITDGFATLMKATWEGKYRCLTPRDFRHTVSKFNNIFASYKQQDSQELLLFLMDGLHEDLNTITDRKYVEEEDNDDMNDQKAAECAWRYHKRLNKSVIVELFQGQFKATMQCLHCNRTSRKFDVFMYLSLPLPSSSCSIYDCIKNFSKVETLTGDNKWRCPSCKTERNARRKMEIWKLPTVLLIHLKRFSYSGRWGDKLQTVVSFPATGLDLHDYVRGPCKRKPYELYSVSHHHGATLDSGHYVASCKNPIDKQWYKYDDHEVSRTSVPQSSSAYILCYTSHPHSLKLSH